MLLSLSNVCELRSCSGVKSWLLNELFWGDTPWYLSEALDSLVCLSKGDRSLSFWKRRSRC